MDHNPNAASAARRGARQPHGKRRCPHLKSRCGGEPLRQAARLVRHSRNHPVQATEHPLRYVRLSNQFILRKDGRCQEYHGVVVASRDAIFLHYTRTRAAGLLSFILDVLWIPGFGRPLARWADRLSPMLADDPAIAIETLPASITADPEWPRHRRQGRDTR